MYVNPNSDLYLLQNVRLTPTYEHTIYFATISAQTEYFASKKAFEFTKLSYIVPENGVIRVKATADALYNCPYLMFKNSAFGSKWFYAFVNSVDYVANGTAEIRFTIDLLQTWYFDARHGAGFIERAHSTTDAVGDNLVPENLDIGEYITELAWSPVGGTVGQIFVASTSDIDSDGNVYNTSGGRIGGVYAGLTIKRFPATLTGFESLNTFITKLTDANKSDAIVSVYICPDAWYNATDPSQMAQQNVTLTRNPLIMGNVRNKKLLTYPYNVILATSPTGDTKVYNYDKFSGDPTFDFRGTVAPPAAARLTPVGYKGLPSNRDEAITVVNSAQIAYNVDTFRAWLAQNGQGVPTILSTVLGVAAGGAAAVGNIGAGNYVGAAIGAANTAAAFIGNVSDFYAKSQAAPRISGNTSPTLDYATASAGLQLFYAHIDAQHVKTLDAYFSRYGYAQNVVAVPNLAARPHWTYVKMQSPCITGNCPQEVLRAYNNAFTTGITYWQNGDEIGDYTLDNSPAT